MFLLIIITTSKQNDNYFKFGLLNHENESPKISRVLVYSSLAVADSSLRSLYEPWLHV